MERSRIRLAALFGAFLSTAAGCSAPAPERIVLVVVDTLRRDHLSPYGAALETPTAQRLADRGQVFPRVVASFHQTTMSMGALFTGRTPSIESDDPRRPVPWTGRSWCGLLRLAAGPDDACVPHHLTTLAESLREHGWRTVGVVANALLFAPSGFEQGFDVWKEVGAVDTSAMRPDEIARQRDASHVLDAVRDAIADLPPERLFLYVHYVDVHDWTYLDDTTYAEAVERMDADVGRLLDVLDAAGLLENATVILTSDHGEALGEPHALKTTKTHLGNPSFEPVLEIPLIVAPARFEDVDATLRSQDLAAMIGEIAGLPPADAPPADSPLAPGELLLSEDHFLTYRSGRWKSVFHRTRPKEWALFDLDADPGETANRLADEPAVVERHLRRIRELNAALATTRDAGDAPSAEDRRRLRALGYLGRELRTEPGAEPGREAGAGGGPAAAP